MAMAAVKDNVHRAIQVNPFSPRLILFFIRCKKNRGWEKAAEPGGKSDSLGITDSSLLFLAFLGDRWQNSICRRASLFFVRKATQFLLVYRGDSFVPSIRFPRDDFESSILRSPQFDAHESTGILQQSSGRSKTARIKTHPKLDSLASIVFQALLQWLKIPFKSHFLNYKECQKCW